MTIKIDKLGWPVAALFAGMATMAALSGFQGPAMKFATVDVLKVYNDSPLTTANNDTLDNAKKSRLATLNFIDQNLAMDPADVRRLADLSSKATPTPAEKTQIDTLRANGVAAMVKRSELATKATLTDADKTQLATYNANANSNRGLLQTLTEQYRDDLGNMANDLRDKTIARVREVVRGIAAKQGYTVVFDSNSAPYAANDLTEEATKALKK